MNSNKEQAAPSLESAESPENPFGSIPDGLVGFYNTANANSRVELFSGSAELVFLTTTLRGECSVFLELSPKPSLRFNFAPGEAVGLRALHLLGDEGVLQLNGSTPSVKCLVTSIGGSISGPLNEPYVSSRDNRVSSVVCHFVNLPEFLGSAVCLRSRKVCVAGRLEATVENWKITVDPVGHDTEPGQLSRDTAGYKITHVGQIQRNDGGEFSVADAENVIEWLRYVFSFCAGRWVASPLHVGLDGIGRRVVEWWSAPLISPSEGTMSWFSDRQPDILSKLLNGFWTRWNQELWGDTLRRAIWWYISAISQAGGIDGAIILIQVALELLAWVVYVEDGHILSRDGFDELPAADKLRLLTNWLSLPVTTPNELPALAAFGRKDIPYGGYKFVEVRNALVHPRSRAKLNGKDKELVEAWTLGLHYLELAILRACAYEGRYVNRLRAQWAGEVEGVPWK